MDTIEFHVGSDPASLLVLPGHDSVFVCGTTVPADGAVGYATGCLFLHLDGGAATALYVNVGTQSSANFDPLSVEGGVQTQGATVITASDDNALAVGPNGSTNPSFQVDTNASSAATGLKITSAAAASGVAIAAISSGTNENLTLDAKGSGTVSLGTVSTGSVVVGANLTINDGKNVVLDSTAGTKIGTAVGQKIGFWNATPIIQPAHADQAALGAVTTVGGNTGTAGAGLTLIGNTTSVDQAANIMNDFRAVQEDLSALFTLVGAIRTALVNSGIMKGAA